MSKTINVQASPAAQELRQAVLFERHPDHPGGEVFISGNDTIHTVAPTAEVMARIKDGRLVEVTAKPKAPKG